jgi:IS30 family transposase
MPPDLKDVVVEERIICDLYRDGLSIAKIAKQLGRHQHYVSRVLKKNRVQIRKHAWVRIKPAYTNLRDEIIRRWGDNQPIANIASSLDMSVLDPCLAGNRYERKSA